MARTFRRQRSSHPISELNVTNLIDLGFTLLIIFMITTSYSSKEQTTPVNLPVTTASKQQPPDTKNKYQVISVSADGRYIWGTQQVTLAELQDKLEDAAKQAKPPVFRIRADGKVDWQKVMTLIDELKRRGLSQVQFDSQAN